MTLLGGIAEGHGVTIWGIAPATVMHRARDELHRRKDLGLHDTMQFTYKNPERSTNPTAAVEGAQAIFVAAMAYEARLPAEGAPDAPGDGPIDGPIDARIDGRIARYAWADYYGALRDALWAVARRLRADGFKAVPFADDNSVVDREVAYRAGIGWFGKNANLLTRGVGSWFVLGSVITTAALPTSPAPQPDGCGTCGRCIPACPTGAIVAPGVIDAGRCLSWLLQRPGEMPVEMRTAVGDRLYGCDDCQEACPPSIVFGRRSPPSSPGPPPTPTQRLDLLDLLDADDDAVLQRWGRWYLAERDPRWIRRNALVALGNVLSGGTGVHVAPALRRRALEVLARYRGSIDPLLAEHADWALSRATTTSAS